MALPIFVDEGLHISRAQGMLNSGDYIHGTGAGKFLHIWWLTSVLHLFDSPLLSARLLSVIAGLSSALTVFLLARLWWPKHNLGWLAAFIYIALPLPLMNDRMALADNLLTTLTMLILIFSVRHTNQLSRATSFALGICLGLSYLTKLNGLIYFVIPIFSVIFLSKDWKISFKSLLLPYLVAFVVILPTIPEFLNQFLSVAIRGLPNPLEPIPTWQWWLYGLAETWFDITTYTTWPVLTLASIRLLYDLKSGNRKASLLMALLFITPLIYIFLGKDVWYSRYLLPMVPILAMLAARTLADLAQLSAQITFGPQKIWLPFLCFVLLMPSFVFDYHLVKQPDKAALTPVDRWQYIVGWPAGYGLPQAVAWLEQEATANGPFTLITTRFSSPVQEGIRLYLQGQPNIYLVSADWRSQKTQLPDLIKEQIRPTFIILNEPADQDQEPLTSLCPTTLATFPKPENHSRLVIEACLDQ
jgi:4-amino-4-deoxy-L-arabinose transferase-like glycosyltransferase